MRIEREGVSHAHRSHVFEAHAVDEAQTPAVLAQQALMSPRVEVGADPFDLEEREHVVVQIADGTKPEPMLEKRHRLDEAVARRVEGSPFGEQPLEGARDLTVLRFRAHHERVERRRIDEHAQRE